MDFLQTTNAYYSQWLGKEEILNRDTGDIQILYSAERNHAQYGYAQQFDLYLFAQANRMVLSYGYKAIDIVTDMRQLLNTIFSVEDLKRILQHFSGRRPDHFIKYVYSQPHESTGIARALTREEYPLYHDFFLKNNPNCKDTSWLQDYFDQMIEKHICYCTIADGQIVSCTDAPGMPYMSDQAQEIGINTVAAYRGKGYATDVCVACAQEIIDSGKCPLWSTNAENIASHRLAEKVGFHKLADVLTLTL